MRRSKDLLVEETAPALLREHWIRKNAAINSGLVVQLFEILKNGKKKETKRNTGMNTKRGAKLHCLTVTLALHGFLFGDCS